MPLLGSTFMKFFNNYAFLSISSESNYFNFILFACTISYYLSKSYKVGYIVTADWSVHNSYYYNYLK